MSRCYIYDYSSCYAISTSNDDVCIHSNDVSTSDSVPPHGNDICPHGDDILNLKYTVLPEQTASTSV